MVRTQIQLTEDQASRLRVIAHEQGRPVAAVVRDAVDRLLAAEASAGWEERKQRALSVVGKYSSEDSDVAERHDDYLSEAFEH